MIERLRVGGSWGLKREVVNVSGGRKVCGNLRVGRGEPGAGEYVGGARRPGLVNEGRDETIRLGAAGGSAVGMGEVMTEALENPRGILLGGHPFEWAQRFRGRRARRGQVLDNCVNAEVGVDILRRPVLLMLPEKRARPPRRAQLRPHSQGRGRRGGIALNSHDVRSSVYE
jgi:hypothetical protein